MSATACRTTDERKPSLLMLACILAHVYGAKYQAFVCAGGRSGEAALRESLSARYTTDRHDAKGLRTYYITGTCDGSKICRITSGSIGNVFAGANVGALLITVTSNTRAWQEGDLGLNKNLCGLNLELERIAKISDSFLSGCTNLVSIDLTSLRGIDAIPGGFLSNCHALKEIDLTPLLNVSKVGYDFLRDCTCLSTVNLNPLRKIESIPSSFLSGCSSLKEVDISLLINVKRFANSLLEGCGGLSTISLPPHIPPHLLPSRIRVLAEHK